MMSNKTVLICLLLSFAFFSNADLNAQANSARTLWLGFTINYKIDDKLSIKNTTLGRFRDNEQGYLNNFHQPFVVYKLNKEHAFGLGYRGTWFESVQDEHWILLEYKLNKKLGENFKIANRLWYQNIIDYNDIEYRDHIRNHLTLHFTKHKTITPYLGIEPWFQLNGENSINRVRSLVGLNWKLHGQISLKTEYFRQETFWTDPNFVQNVLLVGLSANISSKKLMEQNLPKQ